MILQRKIETQYSRQEIEKRIMQCKQIGLPGPKIRDGTFSVTAIVKNNGNRIFMPIKIQGTISDNNSRVISCCVQLTVAVWLVLVAFLCPVIVGFCLLCLGENINCAFLIVGTTIAGMVMLNTVWQEQVCLDRFTERMTG